MNLNRADGNRAPSAVTDRIFIRDLSLACTIGINEWERDILQPVKVDLDLDVDLKAAGEKDDLNFTVDYQVIRDNVEKLVSQSRYFLIEALAEKIADVCLKDPKVRAVRVALEKPGALRSTRTVGVELFRSGQ